MLSPPHEHYPWDTWFKRKGVITLRRNEDYDVQSYVMTQQVRNAAAKRNLKVTVKTLDDRVQFLVLRGAKDG